MIPTLVLPAKFVRKVLKLALAEHNRFSDEKLTLEQFVSNKKEMRKFMSALKLDVQEAYLCDPDNLSDLLVD